MTYYVHLANGDFNIKDGTKCRALKRADFELGIGIGWVLITNRILTDKQYGKLMEDLSLRK